MSLGGSRRSVLRALPALALLLAAPRPASAQAAPAAEQCVEAHFEAQQLRRDRDLRAALRSLTTCADAACPSLIRTECVDWQRGVAADLPTVVLVWDGRETADVRVLFDGTPLVDALEGKAVPVDPGEHVFRFEPRGGAPVERRVVLREGERARVAAEPEAPPEAPRGGPGWPTATWILGGVGIAGVTTFAVFGAAGLSQKGDLDDCAPRCSEDDVDAAARSYVIADVGLLIGVVALGAAVTIALVDEPEEPAALRLEAGAAPSGGGAWLRGGF